MDDEELNAHIEKGAAHAKFSIEEFSMAICEFGKAAGICVNRIAELFNEILGSQNPHGIGEADLYSVATPRQWFLYNHGSPKVRKKWENALRKKVRLSRKRRKS